MSEEVIKMSNEYLASYLRVTAEMAAEIDRSGMSVEEKAVAYVGLVETRLLTILPKPEPKG